MCATQMSRGGLRVLLFRCRPYAPALSNPRDRDPASPQAAKKEILFPPLGLAQVAAVLRSAGYEQVKIIDAWAEDLTDTAFLERVETFNPDVVGCSLWTTSLKSELRVLEKVKQRLPGVTTIVGGPHLDVYPRECLEQYDFIDLGVTGEGEKTVIEVFAALCSGIDSLGAIKGIVYRDDKELVFTGWRPPVKDLDSLPYPDFSGLPVNKYFRDYEKGGPFIYIFTTRGCPSRCRFCFNSRRRVYRKHSVDYVINYIKFLKQRYGVKDLALLDATFTFDKNRTLLFCKQYGEEGIGLPYSVNSRVDHIDEETITALRESGCDWIHYGIQSGVQEILDKMNRKTTLDQARKAVALTKKHGIFVGSDFMIGYLDESMDTYNRTIKFIKELDPDQLNIFITTILPETDLYYEALERGILKPDLWREYVRGGFAGLGVRIPGKDYGVDNLDKMLSAAYRRIYFRPAFVWKKLRTIRDLRQFRRGVTRAMAMLFRPLLGSLMKRTSGN